MLQYNYQQLHLTTDIIYILAKEIKMKVAYLLAVIALCIFAFGTRTADAGYVSFFNPRL